MFARFMGGLNKEIQTILEYKDYTTITRLFHIACKAEREVQDRQAATRTNFSAGRNTSWTSRVPSTSTRPAAPPSTSASMTFPSSVPTSFESLQQGNNKGIDDITSHEDDACIVELNKSCVELPVDLSTPSILDNHVTIMKLPMLNHFDMTSNLGDDYTSNDLLHDCLVKPIVACPSKFFNLYSPLLGWFNDEHCKSLDMNKRFTYICKLSCNTFMSFTYCDDHISFHFTTYESYTYIHVLHVQKLREVRMDEIYIYNMAITD